MSATSDLDRLARDLDTAPARVIAAAHAVVKRGAQNVKTAAVRNATGIGHAPHYPRSISYDVGIKGLAIEAVIGPDKDKTQGALGNILEYGTSNNAPIPHLGPALDEETPRFLKALGDVGADELLP